MFVLYFVFSFLLINLFTYLLNIRRNPTYGDSHSTAIIRMLNESLIYGTVRHYPRDPAFTHFERTPNSERQTDGRIQDDSIYRASIASRGKHLK